MRDWFYLDNAYFDAARGRMLRRGNAVQAMVASRPTGLGGPHLTFPSSPGAGGVGMSC